MCLVYPPKKWNQSNFDKKDDTEAICGSLKRESIQSDKNAIKASFNTPTVIYPIVRYGARMWALNKGNEFHQPFARRCQSYLVNER